MNTLLLAKTKVNNAQNELYMISPIKRFFMSDINAEYDKKSLKVWLPVADSCPKTTAVS